LPFSPSSHAAKNGKNEWLAEAQRRRKRQLNCRILNRQIRVILLIKLFIDLKIVKKQDSPWR
jgi:hypothetical protein